jgi:soluble lytic murein transglycosylase-like protein
MSMVATMFLITSQYLNLPEGLLSALCFVESGHNVQSVNLHDRGSKSLGICQIKLSTARFLGYKGSEKDLFSPQVNIYYAGKFLARNIRRYDGNIYRGVSAYNAGTCRLNRRGQALNNKYVKKVYKAWKEKR